MRASATLRFSLLILLFSLFLGACEDDELDPKEPEGAYGLFMESLSSKDEDKVWEYLDQTTKDLFIEHYKALVRMDKIIEAYFDRSEHKYLRKRTGSYLLKQENITSAVELYHFIFNIDALTFDTDHEVGGTVDEFAYSDEEETIAEIKTRGGQSFIMVKEDDGMWRTASLRPFFEKALAPISASEEAMRTFAEENLLDERERRISVIQFYDKKIVERAAANTAPAQDDDSTDLEMDESEEGALEEEAP